MTIPSNLYADKVFAEHPIALWSLDDDLSGSVTSVSNVSIANAAGIEAVSYGINNSPGYYLTNTSNVLTSTNTGIPMVYGAINITTMYENDNPSIILPAFGFMNKFGKDRAMTYEMWLKINSESSMPKRIFGPISSTDGLYVYGSFLVLKFGHYVESYFVGEWARPMLLDLVITDKTMAMIINGDSAINITIDQDEIDFDSISEIDNWIGFYTYEDIYPIMVDCVAVYSYAVSPLIAQRRYAYGQAVESPENGMILNGSVPIVADYQFSKISSSYVYPDRHKTWNTKSSVIDNLLANKVTLSVPQYSLPTVTSIEGAVDIVEWNNEQLTYQIQEEETNDLSTNELFFITKQKTFTDSSNVSNFVRSYDSCLSFNKFGKILTEGSVESFYGIFEPTTMSTDKEILFGVYGENGEKFEAVLVVNGESIDAKYTYNDKTLTEEKVLKTISSISLDQKYVFGVNIKQLIDSQNDAAINKFFANRNNLLLTVGGNLDQNSSFSGKIYRFGFSNYANKLKTSTWFHADGFANNINQSDFFSHYASYTLFATRTFGLYSLDIAIDASWRDSISLSVLSKKIFDTDNTEKKDIEYLQFNVDFPEPHKYLDEENFISSTVDTSESIVKTYLSFSNLGNYQTYSDENNVPLEYGKTIFPEDSWSTERYEVVNESLIYLPKYTDSTPDPETNELQLNLMIEMKIPGIIRNPISIRSIVVGSRSINRNGTKNIIGTQKGIDVLPFVEVETENGEVKDYSEINPISFYTASTPPLYFNKYSGIGISGKIDSTTPNRGILIPINEVGSSHYHISLIQFAMKTEDLFLDIPVPIMEIQDKTNEYYVYAQRPLGGDGQLAELYVKKIVNGIEEDYTDVEFYINGSMDTTNIKFKEWNMIGIKFTYNEQEGKGLIFDGVSSGYIALIGPFIFNNINNYLITKVEEGSRFLFNHWDKILGTEGSENLWSDYIAVPPAQEITWYDVKVSQSSDVAGRDAASAYKTYFGSNRIVIDSSSVPIRSELYEYDVFSDIRWLQFDQEAV